MQRLTRSSTSLAVRGDLTIHSAPSALRNHIDWALVDLLTPQIRCDWTPQVLKAGTYKCALSWRDREGVASAIATVLRSWHYIYFEVQEDNNNGGELFRCTPELGIHRALTDLSGSVIMNQNQIDAVLAQSFDEESIRLGLSLIIGSDWENELEPFRGVAHQEIAHLRAI
ncbi:MAG: DUF3145 family protein [Actinomycetota bacterium]|nr:DUF3145 family protein [Actinomycetota bacterium]